MDFILSDEQRAIEDGINQIMLGFPDDYWLEKDNPNLFIIISAILHLIAGITTLEARS